MLEFNLSPPGNFCFSILPSVHSGSELCQPDWREREIYHFKTFCAKLVFQLSCSGCIIFVLHQKLEVHLKVKSQFLSIFGTVFSY